jgi:mannose-6-phosphate isomerase
MMERMEGKIQPYAWGSTSFIPDLLGIDRTDEPRAELWLGAHPLAPALVGGHPLDQLVANDPETMVGATSVATFGPRLPFLFKVLAAAKPLSLQAHPTRSQAEAGFTREQEAGIPRDAPDRTYRDGWPKPEVLCALSDAEVLCGFREPVQTFSLFETLGVSSALRLVEPLRDGGSSELREVFARILGLTGADRQVISEVAEAAQQVRDEEPLAEFAKTAGQLSALYPEDPGVLAALLMNRLSLRQNDAIFLPAGYLHAYLHGNGVEIMANSDNVLRGGLTSKHVDVAELMRVLNFTPGFAGLVPCAEESSGVWHYQSPAPEFALWRLEVSGVPTSLPSPQSGRVLLVTDGSVVARSPIAELTLHRGQSAFVTADENDVRLDGQGVVFVAGPGVG